MAESVTLGDVRRRVSIVGRAVVNVHTVRNQRITLLLAYAHKDPLAGMFEPEGLHRNHEVGS